MNDIFQNLYAKFKLGEMPLSEFVGHLPNIGDFSDDLILAIEEQLAKQDRQKISQLVHVVYLVNSSKFANLFCKLLDNYRDDSYMEELAQLSVEIADKRMIPSMIRALDYEAAGDPDYNFNQWLVSALYKIGTPEAIEGIKIAAQSHFELVKEDAENRLREIGQL